MYLLEFLKSAIETEHQVEYRLLCSGTLYRDVMGDWTKSDGARMLLVGPVQLLNASQPPDTYPQELVIRFGIGPVTETEGDFSNSFSPDAEIARDLAAILTLLCRRLVTVACKTRDLYSDEQIPEPMRDFPLPFCADLKPIFWTPRPADIAYGPHGVRVRFNQPPPVEFDAEWISKVLTTLPQLHHADVVVRAARLYALAMESVEVQHEVAYQMLISAVETVAVAALKGWKPDQEDQIASKPGVLARAKTAGLGDEEAEQLVLEVQKDNPWTTKKFVKFLADNVDPGILDTEDDLFIVPDYMRPPKDAFEAAIKKIYYVRCGATHSGQQYPASANVGTSSWLPVDAAHDALSKAMQGKTPFPPVGWFERVAHSAINTFLRNQIEAHADQTSESENT